MKPSDELIEKFRKAYFEEYKKKITRQQARKILVILIEMIGRLRAAISGK